mmetsp:Transcript_159202/g.510681  ORF Transcript_159202/g.510681 Transcript_159202/m.510681 type:complete len:276 (+) Transcript_159202:1359-2186(+)
MPPVHRCVGFSRGSVVPAVLPHRNQQLQQHQTCQRSATRQPEVGGPARQRGRQRWQSRPEIAAWLPEGRVPIDWMPLSISGSCPNAVGTTAWTLAAHSSAPHLQPPKRAASAMGWALQVATSTTRRARTHPKGTTEAPREDQQQRPPKTEPGAVTSVPKTMMAPVAARMEREPVAAPRCPALKTTAEPAAVTAAAARIAATRRQALWRGTTALLSPAMWNERRRGAPVDSTRRARAQRRGEPPSSPAAGVLHLLPGASVKGERRWQTRTQPRSTP